MNPKEFVQNTAYSVLSEERENFCLVGQIVKLSNFQIVKLSNCQTVKLSNSDRKSQLAEKVN